MDPENGSEAGPLMLGNERLHPSLRESYDLGPDIYPNLLSWIFEHECFECWHKGKNNWELRCFGPPGSGKTTLAQLAAQELRKQYASQDSAVAAIFVGEDVRWHEATFIEDFLVSLFRQLTAHHTCDDGDCEVHQAADQYHEAFQNGHRAAARIRLIRRALSCCLGDLQHAFLVLDGIDRYSSTVDLCLADDFDRLRAEGLRILTTSRIPCVKIPIEYYGCDAVDCPKPENRDVYWVCKTCGPLVILCESCKQKNEPCVECGGNEFLQPYDHVDLNILPSGEQMSEYIAWSLEREHGDLGLDTSSEPKPPLSRLGAELMASSEPNAAWDLVSMLEGQAEHNITMARARLDLIDEVASLQAARDTSDRLPGRIAALMDAGLKGIESQTQARRELGLRAIAAAAHSGECGVQFLKLDDWMHEASQLGSLSSNFSHVPHRDLEEVLQASKGLLTAHVPPGELDYFVRPYHGDLAIWVGEGYNESLSWAISHLQFGRLKEGQKISRARTSVEPPSWKKAHRWMGGQQFSTVEEEEEEDGLGELPEDKKAGGELSRPRFKLPRSATAWVN